MAADVTFPALPVVVSLQDYDDVAAAPDSLLAGYPVVCVTVSNVIQWSATGRVANSRRATA